MNARVKEILEDALQLDAVERQELVRLLLASLSTDSEATEEPPADAARAVQARYLDC